MALKDNLRSRSAADLRAERDELGFVRQPAVRWLSPGLLARSGVEVIVSGTFGKFADKREIQREDQHGGSRDAPDPGRQPAPPPPPDPLDYSRDSEIWVDYLSDTGDGWEATYTMAWLLAKPELTAGGETLQRGKVLLLGGDQVYPSATPEQYEDRFIGPFAAALPKSEATSKPDLYAVPGNHDWYDGLVSFLRVFCARDGRVGEWHTRQRRSYFALKMPNDWWIWGIDIQLDTYLDDVQLDYFRSQPVNEGDKIILLTAKPAWIKALPGRAEPPSWRYLSYFEERVVRASRAHLAITLTGDVHHYARYEPAGADAPTRITAGGGGAYLSATHTLKEQLSVRSLDSGADVPYTRSEIYPRDHVSRRLSNGIVKLARLNPSFAALFGGLYVLLGLAMLSALDGAEGGLVKTATGDGFGGLLTGAAGTMSVILVLVLLGGLLGGTDIKPDSAEAKGAARTTLPIAKFLVVLAQVAAHVLLAAGVLWGVLNVVPNDAPALVWVAGLPALFAAGAAIGTTIFAVFLLAIHKWRGDKAHQAANQVFTGQSIDDYKNLVRMRFRSDGGLTLYPLGVDRIGREWRHVADPAAPGPRFVPRGTEPQAVAIDGPLEFDGDGRRMY